MAEGNKILENLFFAVSCIAIFTSVIRSDYNFCLGLLCYYLVKSMSEAKKVISTTKTVSPPFNSPNTIFS